MAEITQPQTAEQQCLDEAKQLATADKNRADLVKLIAEAKPVNELAAWLLANNVVVAEAKILCEQHKAQGCCFPEGGPRFGEAPAKVSEPITENRPSEARLRADKTPKVKETE